jgi:hypothetical protein
VINILVDEISQAIENVCIPEILETRVDIEAGTSVRKVPQFSNDGASICNGSSHCFVETRSGAVNRKKTHPDACW